MDKLRVIMLVLAAAAVVASAEAHNAICSCFDNGDGTIACEGGFSDGGKASGVPMRVVDQSGKVLAEGAMGKDSTFRFAKPKVPFRVEFNGGEGHVITIDGRDIDK